MLIVFLKVIFVIVCIFLVLVVLLQSGKGGDVASAFGGAGSQSAFGPRGPQKPLEKATVVAALLFMFLALLFSLPGFNGTSSVVRDGGVAPVQTSSSPAASPAASPATSPATEASPAGSPATAASPTASPAQ